MLKLKPYLKIRLLLVVLFMFSYVKIHAKDLDFSTSQPCNSYEQEYEINFDNAGDLEWIIEGGEIVEVGNDKYPEQLANEQIGTRYYTNGDIINWPFTINYTRMRFYGQFGKLEVTFDGPNGPVFAETDATSPNKGPVFNNPLKKIKVRWYQVYNGPKRITCIGKGLGFTGFDSGNTTKYISFPAPIPNFTLIANNLNPFCDQVVTIEGAPSATTNNWFAPGVSVGAYWPTGFNINSFAKEGPVTITVVASNQCYSVPKSITLNVRKPDFGNVRQGQNIVDDGSSVVQPDCQGNFYLDMRWVSNNAIYTWELPDAYNNQTNTFTRKTVSGRNMINVSGTLPQGALTDFVGKVTITGVCGNPVVKTFIVRPTLQPSVDADIYSCSSKVLINVNNPNGSSPINAWVTTSTPLGGWGTFENNTSTSTTFKASKAADFVVIINLNVNGCSSLLQTNVHVQSASVNQDVGAKGWQSGVLSDNRKAPGSNLATYNGNIYFTGRDGIIYYYSFSNALQKWVINQIPGINNASIPAGHSFNKIGIATSNNITYLYFIENTGLFKKVNLATNVVEDGMGFRLLANDFIANGNDVYAIQSGTNVLYQNGNLTTYTLPGCLLKTIVPGYGVSYIQNNNLFTSSLGQITFSNDVYPSSDVVVYNGWVYFARGQKGTANIYRLPIGSTNSVQQITSSSNLSGVFTINPASGVIYYGVLNAGALNTTFTVASGNYKSANIYQAYQQNGIWLFKPATSVKPREGLDMYIQSPIYTGNHLYYIGAGHNAAIGNSYELEVWNLYYENACAPDIQRIATITSDEAISPEATIYPNPFANVLQIDLSAYTEKSGKQQAVEIVILDAAGKEMYSNSHISELSTINTGDWAAGMYMIKITSNNKSIIKKAIKI